MTPATLPHLHCGDSPAGGCCYHASCGGRAFHAALRRIPGRLVHTRTVGGVRIVVGWTAIDTVEDLMVKIDRLRLWVSAGS